MVSCTLVIGYYISGRYKSDMTWEGNKKEYFLDGARSPDINMGSLIANQAYQFHQ